MFFELHTRSAFSFLASGSMPEGLARRAAELGLGGIAMLDRDTVSGAVRLHHEARGLGIKAIIGAEITMDDGSLLPLVPLDLTGYQNLCKLITNIKLRSPKGEHCAARKDIEEHSAGLMCFTGGADGFVHNAIKNRSGQRDLAWLNYVFEKRLYVELQRHFLRSEEDINLQLAGLAHKLHIPVFASNGAYYATEQDRELFDVFTCIKNHCTIYEAGKILSQNGERYLKPEAEMLKLFDDYPGAVEITEEIAARINFSMDDVGYTFPDYPVGPGETMDSMLRQLSESGAIRRYGSLTPKVKAKLDHELKLIEKMKLAGYFLLVWEISDFCRKNNILSQGRGSAANSVVCYALGITAVDPIEADLLFERFLSENRTEYPDIDIDLPSGDDRELVIQHVYEKYGRRGAAMTANVITYRGRSAVREVGKVFGFEEEQIGKLSKSISHHGVSDFPEMLVRFKESGFNLTDDFRTRKFVELYTRILDFPRHLGQHSGGMVISMNRLDGVVPIEPASMEGRTIIQWDKDDCERQGIVKVDLLGLGMMAVLRDTITLIREHRGEEVDLGQLPKDDPEVYKTLQNADTIGMFQVESRAQISFLPKSKPTNFYDLVVQVAIIRPGPIVGNMLKGYLARRLGKEEIDYMHPSFEPFLKRTLGVPLFQEQLLRMAMVIAGFSGGEAEELRRAMGFKRADKRLGKIEQRLRDGMADKGIDDDTQEKIVSNIMAFANYGFPESHAASFALLTYASAYLKVHYLAEFTTAMLNNYPLGFYSPATLIKDAQRHGLRFRYLDVNYSDYLFTIESQNRPPERMGPLQKPARSKGETESQNHLRERVDFSCDAEKQRHEDTERTPLQKPARSKGETGPGKTTPGEVRVGLKYVKGLRKEIAEAIVAEREKCSIEQAGGNATGRERAATLVFQSVEDLIRRVPAINKKEIRALSLAGALNFEKQVHRRQALWDSELAIQPSGPLFEDSSLTADEGRSLTVREGFENAECGMRNAESDPESRVQNPESETAFIKKMTEWQLMETDLNATGITIGKHPMAFIREELKKKGVLSAAETSGLKKKDIVTVAGSVIVRQRPSTAKSVVFITMEDETGHSNFIVMPDVFERFRAVITHSNYLLIRGIVEDGSMIKGLYFQPINAFMAGVQSHDFH